MNLESYFYSCSPDYIYSINQFLQVEVFSIINQLPKRQTQSQINSDLFWLLMSKGWDFDSLPQGGGEIPPKDLDLLIDTGKSKKINNRILFRTSTTLKTKWYADFAKAFGYKLVQIVPSSARWRLCSRTFVDFG